MPDDSTARESECDDSLAIERIARDSRNIVIAKVKDRQMLSKEPDLDSRSYQMTLALRSGLKLRAQWNSQAPLELLLAYPISVISASTRKLGAYFFQG